MFLHKYLQWLRAQEESQEDLAFSFRSVGSPIRRNIDRRNVTSLKNEAEYEEKPCQSERESEGVTIELLHQDTRHNQSIESKPLITN